MPDKSAIRDLMDKVADAQSLEHLCAAALDSLERTLHVERSAVLVHDPSQVMRFVASRGISDRYRQVVEGHSPWNAGERAAAPILIPDVRAAPELDALWSELENEGIRALAFIPMRFGTKLLGKFMLYYRDPHEFSDNEITTAEIIAGHIAFAFEHRRITDELHSLYQSAEEARSNAEKARGRLQTLAELSADLASSLDRESMLKGLADRIVATMADYAITYIYDGQTIRRVGLAHRVAEKQPLLRALDESGPPRTDDPFGVGLVLRTGEPILAEDITGEQLRRSASSAGRLSALLGLAPRSAMVVPMNARGRAIVAITLATTVDSSRRYGPDDLKLVVELANRAALLVDNARSYAEAKRAVTARDDMIAVVSHDLRNPLQSIASAAALLELAPDSGSRRARTLNSITLAVSQMQHLLDDLLDVSKIEAGKFSVTPAEVAIGPLIDEAVTLFLPLVEPKAVRLRTHVPPDLPEVRADAPRIVQVLSNLIGNAVKHVRVGGRIDIEASTTAGGIRVTVADDGCGIPEEHIPSVFDRFWRANRREEGGAGLGLALVKGIIEAHGGRVGLQSRVGEGSRFFFELDVAEDSSAPAGTQQTMPADEDLAVAARGSATAS